MLKITKRESMSVRELDISTRTLNALISNGINNTSELLHKGRSWQLTALKCDRFGKRSLKDLEKALKRKGLIDA